MFSAAWTNDIRVAALHIKQNNPGSHMFAVGFSLGANILTKYLGEEKENTPFVGAVSLGNPFDLMATNEHLESNLIGRFYNSKLTVGLVSYARRYIHFFQRFQKRSKIFYNFLKKKRNEKQLSLVPGVIMQEVLNSKTVREFDSKLVIKVFGYKSTEEYYRDASSNKYVKDIAIPFLIINAKDDPISLSSSIPIENLKENPNLFFVIHFLLFCCKKIS